MSTALNRRRFIARSLQGAAAASAWPGLEAGAFVLGFGSHAKAAVPGTPAVGPEINAWVVIRPDDSVIIRIARSDQPARKAQHAREPHRLGRRDGDGEDGLFAGGGAQRLQRGGGKGGGYGEGGGKREADHGGTSGLTGMRWERSGDGRM